MIFFSTKKYLLNKKFKLFVKLFFIYYNMSYIMLVIYYRKLLESIAKKYFSITKVYTNCDDLIYQGCCD